MLLLCRRVWLCLAACSAVAVLRQLSPTIYVLRFADLHILHTTRVLSVERTPSEFVMAMKPKCCHTADVKAAGGFSISKPDFAFAFGIFHVVASRYLIMLEPTRLVNSHSNPTDIYIQPYKDVLNSTPRMIPTVQWSQEVPPQCYELSARKYTEHR